MLHVDASPQSNSNPNETFHCIIPCMLVHNQTRQTEGMIFPVLNLGELDAIGDPAPPLLSGATSQAVRHGLASP